MPSAEAMVALLPDIRLIAPYASMCPSTTHCTQSPTSNEGAAITVFPAEPRRAAMVR